MTSTIFSRAPGKLILSGEHAVVYGQPALAIAVNRHATVALEPGGDGIEIRLPAMSVLMRYTGAEVSRLRGRIEAHYAHFVAGEMPIGQVLEDPLLLLPFAMGLIAHEARISTLPAAELTVEMGMPIGSGMGSSAAVGLAMLAAVRQWLGLPLDKDALYRESLACERLQHGRPSGVDSWICTHGGAVRFTREERTPLQLPALPLTLIHTGAPKASTGECVSQVRERFGKRYEWAAFGDCTESIQAALMTADTPSLRAAIRLNHRLLVEIGVVPREVATLIGEIEARGGAAKICGAGSVKGERAGMVIVSCDEPLTDLFAKHQMTEMPLDGDRDGTRLDSSIGSR